MKVSKLLALLAVLAMVVAACGPGETADTTAPEDGATTEATDTTAATDTTEPAVTGEAGAGGTLLLQMWQAPSIVNPLLSTGSKDVMAGSLVLEPLANFGPDTSVVPKLATEVPTVENGGISEDLMSITWTLQEGVVWSDGTPLTAADAVFTWEYCTTEATGCAFSANFAGVESVEAVDDLTIQVNFEAPTPYPYLPFVSAQSPILQAAQFADCVGEAARGCTEQNSSPIGTGPYMVSNFLVEDTVTYEFNPMYRGVEEGKPFFTTVEIKGGGDANAAAESVLLREEADYAWNLQVPPELLLPMQDEGLGTVFTGFAGNVEHLNLNQTDPRSDNSSDFMDGNNPHPVFHDNPEFAMALSMAINRDELVAVGYGDTGRATCDVWAPLENPCPPQDIDGANAILDGLGYMDTNGDGIREHPEFGELVFDYVTSTNVVRQNFQDLIESYWAQIGIGTNPRNVDAGVYFSGDGAVDSLVRFNADIQMYTFVPTPDPQAHFLGYITEQMTDSSNNYGGSNATRVSIAEFDALWEELAGTAGFDERAAIVDQLNQILVDSGAVIPLVWRASVSAFANDIQGVGELNGWDSEYWNIEDWTRSS